MDNITLGPALAVVAAQLATMQRVPPIMNDDDLMPDMGRMTQGSLWGENRGCSPDPIVGARAADVYTLIITAKLNGVDPRAWLADVLRRMAD